MIYHSFCALHDYAFLVQSLMKHVLAPSFWMALEFSNSNNQQQQQTDYYTNRARILFSLFFFLLPKPHKEKKEPSPQCPSSRNREPSMAIYLAMVRKFRQRLASHDPN